MTPGQERLTALAVSAGGIQRRILAEERAKYEKAMADYQRQQENAAREAKRKGLGGTLGSVLGMAGGGALGFMASGGNPLGAMAGASAGGALGGSIGGGLASGDYSPGPLQEQMIGQIPQSLMMYYLYGQGGGMGGAGGIKPNYGAPNASLGTQRPSVSMLGSRGY